VGRKVLEGVESLTKETESLVLVGVVAVLLVAATELDTAEKSTADKALGRIPVSVLCMSAMTFNSGRSPLAM